MKKLISLIFITLSISILNNSFTSITPLQTLTVQKVLLPKDETNKKNFIKASSRAIKKFTYLASVAEKKLNNKNRRTQNKTKSQTKNTMGIQSVYSELSADSVGNIILSTGRYMVDNGEIIRGSCWDFVNAVFNKAGFGERKKIIYKGTKKGPYADLDLIKPGDWLYYINYSFFRVEHSGIFVAWKDYDKKIAIILSYRGRYRNETANYGSYNLKGVYYIQRGY